MGDCTHLAPIFVFDRARLGSEACSEALASRLGCQVGALSGPLGGLATAIPPGGATVILLPAGPKQRAAVHALLRGRDDVVLVDADRFVGRGMAALAEAVLAPGACAVRPDAALGEPRAGAGAVELLSARQRQVLELLAAGATNLEAATAMGVSVNTLRFHVRGIFQRLSVHTRRDAVLLLGEDPHPSSRDARA